MKKQKETPLTKNQKQPMEKDNHKCDDINISDLDCENCKIRPAENYVEGKAICSLCEYSTDEKMKEYQLKKNKIEDAKQLTEAEKQIEENKKEYGKSILKENKVETPTDVIASASKFFMKKTTNTNYLKPDAVNYDLARVIFWNYFKEIVLKEKGIKPVFNDGGNEVWFLERFVKWLIGEKSALGYFPENSDGLFNPDRSLFIWGELGTGKSTIALAGHYLMDFFKSKYGWKERAYKFKSMDELFLSTYTSQSLKEIGSLAKDYYCIDELREVHLDYKHYGQDLKIINDILSARHNFWKKTGKNTLITSNVNPSVLKNLISDDRLIDRIKQQYVFVQLTGDNKREI